VQRLEQSAGPLVRASEGGDPGAARDGLAFLDGSLTDRTGNVVATPTAMARVTAFARFAA
jgi:hypothetical protein